MAGRYIIGSDEVGTGAWAGPVLVCAVAVPDIWELPPGLNDSKELSPKQREALYPVLYKLPHKLVQVSNEMLDRHGMGHALKAAHVHVHLELRTEFPNSEAIADGCLKLPLTWVRSIPKADATYPAVMAASIIAKVNRDALMREYHKMYSHYGFDTNVGYGGNKAHREGLKTYGPCPIHRRSYAPIKKLLQTT